MTGTTGTFPILWLSAVAWGKLVGALVPADPTITAAALLPRQNNDRFIGWVEASGTYSEECNPGLTWYQDGNYAQCCPATVPHCYAPTACVGGSLIYPYPESSTTVTVACTENFNDAAYSVCNTAFIFENFGDSAPKTDIVCGDSSVNWSYYRKIPASATEVVSSAAPSLPPGIANTPTSGPVGSGSSRPTPTTITQPQPKKKSSKAWVAGVVVGPIIAIALIAIIAVFILRRKKKRAQHGAATASQPHIQPFTEVKPQFTTQPSYGQPSPGYNPNDLYGQQGYGASPPLSPAPQYSAPLAPPLQGAYAPDKQPQYQGPSHPEAAELGGTSTFNATEAPSHAVELPVENGKKK